MLKCDSKETKENQDALQTRYTHFATICNGMKYLDGIIKHDCSVIAYY